jgi:hypothetical protein
LKQKLIIFAIEKLKTKKSPKKTRKMKLPPSKRRPSLPLQRKQSLRLRLRKSNASRKS